jgi:futalosine hydrolase
MRILLVGATKFEIAPLLKKFKKISSAGKISSYHFGNHFIDVLITDPGIANTSFYLGKKLSKKYDLAINAGIAGSFRKNIQPGTVVNVVEDCFSDFGAEDRNIFFTAEEIGLVKKTRLKNKSFRNRLLASLPKIKAITVNTVHGNETSIKKVVKKFNPDIESMEGAAFFLACQTEKNLCLQIRAISNYVEKRNKRNWKINLAVLNLSHFLESFLSSI